MRCGRKPLVLWINGIRLQGAPVILEFVGARGKRSQEAFRQALREGAPYVNPAGERFELSLEPPAPPPAPEYAPRRLGEPLIRPVRHRLGSSEAGV